MMVHDLLTESLLSWRDALRRKYMATIPELLEKLGTGEVADFPRVRPHQLHAWSMFLTQLAAIALHRAGRRDARASESEWREMLLALTEGAHEPWSLVVGNLAKPAFFQPPIPEARDAAWNIGACWKEAERPDDIDILVLSKGHDVKSQRTSSVDSERWAHALVTLQTMQGYSGGKGGYKGIARMKGGYGNRPRVGLSTDQTLGARSIATWRFCSTPGRSSLRAATVGTATC